MKKSILMIVDVQQGQIHQHPYNINNVLANINKLQVAALNQGIEVVHIRHDGGANDVLAYGSEGWEIADVIWKASPGVVIDKRYNSAFKNTKLKEYLDSKDISTIVLVGMNTDKCIDTTCKVAFEHGYELIVPKDTTTTFDASNLSAKYIVSYYEQDIWNNRFAKVLDVDKVIENHFKYE